MPDIPEELTTLTSSIVDNLIDGLSGSAPINPKTQIPAGPGLLPTPSRDLEAFFCEVQTVLTDYQTRKGINSEYHVTLSEEHPPKDLKTQIITYKMVQSLPGKVSRGRAGPSNAAGDRHEWVPRCRYVIDDPEKPNSKTIVMGQYEDNMIEFTCWARSNKAANRTVRMFQDLLGIYRFYFKLKGFPEVLYKGREKDITLDSSIQDPLKGRPLRYLVRTDRTFTIHEPVLRDIILNLVLSNS
jgi:hypothetical protein